MNMPHMQQQPAGGLPHDPNHPQLQPVYVTLGQPPFVPQVPYPPELGNHVPFLVSVALMEIQNNMSKNQLRMFFYNLASANGYLNDTFNRLVYFSSQYTVMLLKSGQLQLPPDQAIMAVVPEMVTMFTSAAARDYPALAAFMQPQQQQEAAGLIGRLDNIIGAVQQYVQSGGQMGMQMGMQRPMYGQQPQVFGGGAPMGYPQQPMQQMQPYGQAPMAPSGPIFGNTGAAGMQFQQQNQQPASSPVSPGVATRARANSERMRQQLAQQLSDQGQGPAPAPAAPSWQPQPTPVAQASQTSVRRHRTAADVLEPAASQPPMMTTFTASGPTPTIETRPATSLPTFTGDVDVLAQNVSNETVVAGNNSGNWPFGQSVPAPQPATESKVQEREVEVLPDASTWRSHQGSRYLPGFNSLLTRPNYVTEDGHNVTVAFYRRNPEEVQDMDYHKHAIGFVPTQESLLPKPEVLPGDEPIVNKPVNLAKLEIQHHPQARMESDEESAAVNYEFEARLTGKIGYSKPGKAYRASAVIAKPIVCDTVEIAQQLRTQLQVLHQAGSFEQACKLIEDLNAPEQLQVRTIVNDILTAEVNDALRMRMSLTDWIDDFCEDVLDLDAHLRKRYGDSVATALSRMEGRLISTAIDVLGEDEAVEYTNTQTDGLEGVEEPKDRVVYLTHRVSYTYLSVNAHELHFAAVPDLPAMVQEEENSALYAVVKSLYEDTELRKHAHKRHYLFTLDGVKFQATRGLLNSEAYLVKRLRPVAG